MKPALALVPLALALAAAGCGGQSGGYAKPAAARATTTVGTRNTELGTVLVDGQGRTLYLFEKDKGKVSACAGSCASVWPPLVGAAPEATGTAAAAQLGSSARGDGKSGITYAGHPLYTYAGDTKPGDVKGQGLDQFGAEWYALKPDGRKLDDDA